MEISPLKLTMLLLFSLLYGICIGMVNDINRIVRVFFGIRYTKINFNKLYAFLKIHNEEQTSKKEKSNNIFLNILIFIQDLLLMLFAAVGLILLNYYFNDGRFRLFAVLAMLFSAIIYYFTVGKLIMLVSEPIMLIVRTSVMFLIRIITLPIRTVLRYIYRVVKNTISKSKKYLAKKLNIRYNKTEVERLCALSKLGFLDMTNNKDHKEYED